MKKVSSLLLMIFTLAACTTPSNSKGNESISSSSVSNVVSSSTVVSTGNQQSSTPVVSTGVQESTTTSSTVSSSTVVSTGNQQSSTPVISTGVQESTTTSSIVSSSTTSSTVVSTGGQQSSSSIVSSSTQSSSSQVSSSSPNTSIGGGTINTNKLYDATLESTAPNYYESVRGLKGEALKNALNELIDDHTTYSYGSSINGYMKEYDVDPDNSNNIILVYTGTTSKNTSFNKEHVWAKSHGEFGTGRGAGSDLHNLRPCIENLNSSRGNKDFAEGGSEYSSWKGNYSTSSTFEPRDDFKGDVARTIFYMATRYNDSGVDLELNSPSNKTRYNDFSSGATGIHGMFDDLYKWATSGIDPVNNYEVNRNNIIYDKYQHNRNPFVDHPEFIIMIYDKTYNGAGALNDLNPGEEDPQVSANGVISLINKIGNVTLNSLNAIVAAEEAYNALNPTAKALVTNYNVLVAARSSYDALYNETIVENIINDINSIGEVTLEDKTLIEDLENKYSKLTSTQKDQVTNYNVLVSAREQLNRLISQAEQLNKVLYTGAFGDSTGADQKYGEYNITLNGQKWNANYAYKQGAEFRLGHNKAKTIDQKYYSALGLTSSPDGSVLSMSWDIKNSHSISFETSGKYGTVSKVYILKSVDGGTTYTKCLELSYSESLTLIEYKGETESSVRYALVITGSMPRLKLTTVTISGIE